MRNLPSVKIIICLFLGFACLSVPHSLAKEEAILVLVRAIEKGELKTVQALLATGIDPNQRIPDSHLNHTPLFLAVKANQLAIIEELLKEGAAQAIEDDNGNPVITMAADPAGPSTEAGRHRPMKEPPTWTS
jgi:ankyrin repeat protein